ncbi:hypothetical protein PIB30_089587, partial [Stylosanthes scabra]|nr:hypothetical protein [Stylosanthes scabra]
FRWTPYDSPEMQALIPDWMRAHPEVYTWRSAVPVVCLNFVHMHHIDRVIRQYGGEQPVPRLPVDVTRYMSSTGRGDDQYYKWFARVARRGRFLSRAADLADPRWTLGPAGIPVAAVHPRDDLVMPDDAPAPRRRQPQMPRPRQAAPVRGKLSRRDQRRRLRMVEVGAVAHVDEEQAEEQREYDRQDEPVDGGEAQFHDDHQDPSMSPSGMISFSPDAARAFPSPARAGTSSQPEIGTHHAAPCRHGAISDSADPRYMGNLNLCRISGSADSRYIKSSFRTCRARDMGGVPKMRLNTTTAASYSIRRHHDDGESDE